ncbi:MAG: aminoglycoside phosphotransferase family protein [Ktedonobacteraceae bacterium]
MVSIPDAFARFMVDLHGEEGHAWLKRLPAILVACEQRWHLTLDIPFPNVSFHYVIPGVRDDGTPVVLKAQSPTGEFTKETEALRLFDGHGIAHLLAYDADDEVMLLERLHPGTSLRNMEDDERAISIAANVMKRLWRPAPYVHPFATVEKWGRGFVRLRQHYGGGNGPFPKALLEEAETLYAELSTSMAKPMLLHGDLHQDNILSSERDGWLAIDPKGLIGESAYETGALLRNFLPELLEMPDPKRILARRVDQLSEELNFDRTRIRGWGLSQAVLSAWWGVEDSGQLGEGSLTCARLLSEITI